MRTFLNNLPVNKAETAVLKFSVVACAEAAPRVRAPRIPSQKPAGLPKLFWVTCTEVRSHTQSHSQSWGRAGPHNWSFHLLRPRLGVSRGTPARADWPAASARPPGPTVRLRQGSMRDAMGQGRGGLSHALLPPQQPDGWAGQSARRGAKGWGWGSGLMGQGSLGFAIHGRFRLTSAPKKTAAPPQRCTEAGVLAGAAAEHVVPPWNSFCPHSHAGQHAP